jgi:hypothetical protein
LVVPSQLWLLVAGKSLTRSRLPEALNVTTPRNV